MALAQATLIKRIRRELGDEPWEDYLTALYTAGSGSVTVNQPTQLAEGDVLEFADGTQLRVRATPSANPVSVKGGHNDTTDTNQVSGAVFLKNPRYAYHEITEAIERVAEELWPWVWRVGTTTLTAVQGQRYYPLPADCLGIISVTQDLTVTSGRYRVLQYGARDSGYPISYITNAPTTISSTGKALYIPFVRTSPNANIYVRYARAATATVTGGNYVDFDDGLFAAMIVRGAVAEILEDHETRRLHDDVDQGEIGISVGTRLRNAAWHRERFERLRERMNLMLEVEAPIASMWAR